MSHSAIAEDKTTNARTRPRPGPALVRDWSSDQRAFKDVPWGKAMMWIFLLSDTFIFSCFLLSYMTVRMSTLDQWPNPSEVFALHIGGRDVPLILIAIMTFVLICSSGTMALAVKFGYQRNRRMTAALMLVTAALGATFVGMQAFEWTKLITEGVRPWGNPWGAPQFGSTFFMITGFHGTHVTIGVIFLIIIARKVLRGDFDASGRASSPAARALRDRRDHRASTGTSSTWSGSSSSLSSISGEGHGTRRVRHAQGQQAHASRRMASSIRSASICGSGACCSSSAPARTWSTIFTCRACCAIR